MDNKEFRKENPDYVSAEEYVDKLIEMKEFLQKSRRGDVSAIFMDMLHVFKISIKVHGKDYESYVSKNDDSGTATIDFD